MDFSRHSILSKKKILNEFFAVVFLHKHNGHSCARLILELWWWRRRRWKYRTWYWNWSNWRWCARAAALWSLMPVRMIVWSRCRRWRTWLSIITISGFSQTVAVDAARSVASCSQNVCAIVMWLTRQRRSNAGMRTIFIALIAKIGRFSWWRWRWLIHLFIVSIVRTMTIGSRRLWTGRWIYVANASVCCRTRSAGYIVSIVTICHCRSTIKCWHSHIFRHSCDFRHMSRFMRCRRKWIHCLIILWFISATSQFCTTHLRAPHICICNQTNYNHHHKNANENSFPIRNWGNSTIL